MLAWGTNYDMHWTFTVDTGGRSHSRSNPPHRSRLKKGLPGNGGRSLSFGVGRGEGVGRQCWSEVRVIEFLICSLFSPLIGSPSRSWILGGKILGDAWFLDMVSLKVTNSYIDWIQTLLFPLFLPLLSYDQLKTHSPPQQQQLGFTEVLIISMTTMAASLTQCNTIGASQEATGRRCQVSIYAVLPGQQPWPSMA